VLALAQASTGQIPILHAIVLGITQGLSEFLPISSSGHLILVPWAFGWDELTRNPELNRAFDVALHMGTFVGALVYFRADVARFAGAAEEQISAMGLAGQVDQLVKVESNSPGNVPWALIAVFAVFAIAGIVLLDRAARKKRSLPPATGPTVATPRKGAETGH